MNEHVVSAIIGLDKAKALLAIEPLHGACRHFLLQSISRVTITRLHSTGRCLWEIANGRIQKGTAANRISAMYMLISGTKQVRRDANPKLGSPFQKESHCSYSTRDLRHMIVRSQAGR